MRLGCHKLSINNHGRPHAFLGGERRGGGAPFDYAVRIRPIQIVCVWGGRAVCYRPIQRGGGGGLSAFGRFNLWAVRMYVNFYYKAGGGGGTPMIMVCDTLCMQTEVIIMKCMQLKVYKCSLVQSHMHA